MSTLEKFLQTRLGRHAVSLVLGLGIGVLFHYLLFRLSLPVQPFIYVAF
jgi:hypothetical protein